MCKGATMVHHDLERFLSGILPLSFSKRDYLLHPGSHSKNQVAVFGN
jgi:hypothetical protein